MGGRGSSFGGVERGGFEGVEGGLGEDPDAEKEGNDESARISELSNQ